MLETWELDIFSRRREMFYRDFYDHWTIEDRLGREKRRNRKSVERNTMSNVWPARSTTLERAIDTLQLHLIGDLRYVWTISRAHHATNYVEHSLGSRLSSVGLAIDAYEKPGYNSRIRNRVDLHVGSYANYIVMHD